MKSYSHLGKAISVITMCGQDKSYLAINEERARSAKEVADALDVTEQDVNKFLFPDGQMQKGPLLCIEAGETLANLRVLCLLGFAGTLARERMKVAV